MMRVQEISSTIKSWDWDEALGHLGIDDPCGAMESLYELYGNEIRNAMDLAGTRKLREILSRSEIQSAFKLSKTKKKA
jgi:hypothetical protein